MPEKLIDLHLHTFHSDGRCSPKDAVEHVRRAGMVAFAITDHDSFAAIDEARECAGELEFVSGIELSCTYEDYDIHMLAYFVDHKYKPLAAKVKFYQKERLLRGEAIVKKLNELGIDLHMDTVSRLAGQAAVGRAHVADALLKEEYVNTFDEAFSRFLGYHAPAYVAKTYFDPAEAIDLVHRAGGLAFMAHPGSTRRDDAIKHFKELGLDGVEVYHPKHTTTQIRHYKEMAARLELLASGGSDWHGRDDMRTQLGGQRVPYGLLAKMKDHLEKRR